MDVLSKIIDRKRLRLDGTKQSLPLEKIRELARQARDSAGTHRLARAMKDERRANIIAEFKRRSPSKGEINVAADPAKMASAYESGGAAAISVLTEEDYFAGSLDDLRAARRMTSLPILRKDFIFDEYQVYESAAAGADAVLLIVRVLDEESLKRLRRLAEDELGMDALVEVHTRDELEIALNAGARLLGVNNRDLRTFSVSTEVSAQLAQLVPPEVILISESGLTPAEVRRLRAIGFRGFLVGEALMTANDPCLALSNFVEVLTEPDSTETVRVKICGITNLEDARAAIAAGADMLGFNFYHASPRYIEPEQARLIINAVRTEAAPGRRVAAVGVFVDERSPEELLRIAEAAGVDAVQLHGDESIEFCVAVKRLAPRLSIIKVLRVIDGLERADPGRYSADAVMLDSFHAQLRGGTGRSFDWTIARDIRESVPQLFLAGGLTPENVGAAISAVQPYAVDACSSLEISPGKKDAARMKQFVGAARGEVNCQRVPGK